VGCTCLSGARENKTQGPRIREVKGSEDVGQVASVASYLTSYLSSSLLMVPQSNQPVPLHSHPTSKSPIVAMISRPYAVETKEFDYEARAAVVYEMADDWVLVRMIMDSSSYKLGWIHPSSRGPFHPVEDLFKSGLCYLTTDWDGLLYSDAGNSKLTNQCSGCASGAPLISIRWTIYSNWRIRQQTPI